jgi:hypothetical protein
MAVTLANLRTQARYRADMENSQFISDTELNHYINNSLGELYDLLVATYGVDNFVDGYDFTTVSGLREYFALPSNFYKTAGVDVTVSGEVHSLARFNFNDRNLYRSSVQNVNSIPRFRYRIFNNKVLIHPAPDGAYSATLWYIPQITALSSDTAAVQNTIVESWLEYVVVDAAIKMLIKEESDTTILMAAKGQLAQRIQASANRDIETPEVQQDDENSLWNLRIRAKHKANMTNSNIVSDTELNLYINESIGELYDMLVKAYGNDYFLDGYSMNTAADQSDYPLPSDFYKLAGIDITHSGEKYSLLRFNFNERNVYTNTYVTRSGVPYYRYRLIGGDLKLLPTPDSAYPLTIWYIPQVDKLSRDNHHLSLNIISTWADYIVIDAAIKMLGKALSMGNQGAQVTLQTLMGQKAGMMQRLTEMAEARDFGQPETITDTAKASWDYWDEGWL